MGIKEFQEDLRQGVSLHDALCKHDYNLKDVFYTLHHQVKYPRRESNGTVSEDIINQGESFYIVHAFRDECKRSKYHSVHYGSYKSLNDAECMREALKKCNWDKLKVNSLCKKLGITRNGSLREDIYGEYI